MIKILNTIRKTNIKDGDILYSSTFDIIDTNFELLKNVTNNGSSSNIILNSEILWKVKNTGEPIYSSIVEVTLSTGVKALIYSSWDWYIYCRNADTGELIWRYATNAPCYGRCQAQDINEDGKIEVIGSSHDGKIYCLSENGTLLWLFKNLYDREGTGTISSRRYRI